MFMCQLCDFKCIEQLRFYFHMKLHYEPENNLQESGSILQSLLVNNKQIENPTIISDNTKDQVISDVNAGSMPLSNQNEINGNLKQEELTNNISAQNIAQENLKLEVVTSKKKLNQRNKIKLLKSDNAKKDKAESNSETITTTAIGDFIIPKKRNGSYSCVICERTFGHRNSLIYHLNRHSGVRPFSCDLCESKFFAKNALQVHLRTHSGTKPFKCQFCESRFARSCDLSYHCASKHSEHKEYQCEFCGKDFARRYSLIIHRRIHTGERSHSCEFCGKSFRAATYLANHRRIHTGEKPYTCNVCQKPFRLNSDMKRHTRTHFKERWVSQSSNEDKTSSPTLPTGSEDSTLTETDNSSQGFEVKTVPQLNDEISMSLEVDENGILTIRKDETGNNPVYVWVTPTGETIITAQ